MKSILHIISCIGFILIYNNAKAQVRKNDCYINVISESMLNKIDSNMCIPKGYKVVQVNDNFDLNCDRLKDKILKYIKDKPEDGDSTYYKIYFQNSDKTYSTYKVLGNLLPLYFKRYELEFNSKTPYLDSIKNSYYRPTLSSVNFGSCEISVLFYLDAGTFKILFFKYNQQNNSWLLHKEEEWEDLTYLGGDKRKKFQREAYNEKIKIEDFNILEYTLE